MDGPVREYAPDVVCRIRTNQKDGKVCASMRT